MKMIASLISILLFFNIELPAKEFKESDSDNASLSGIVRDKESKETLIGATVFIESTKYGARTNQIGFYSISNIPPGSYKVRISFLGYEHLYINISLKKGESFRKDFELSQTTIMKEGVYVDANKDNDKREISISKVNIPIETIKNIRVGGESDIFRTLQFLPGVLTSSQISSGLFVRGGSPDQNLVLLDGATVYNPTHLFGFISTFNSDAIKNVDLIKGGFPAEYGGRLSAVLDITQKDGNKDHIEGVASIGAISSRIGLEGPTPWEGGSWFISGRRTYFDLVKQFIPEDPESPIPDFGFYDVNAKISQDIGLNDKISVSGFLSKDNLEFSSFGLNMNLSIGNNLLTSKWTHIFGSNLFSTVVGSYSKYFNNFDGDHSGYEFLFENSISDLTLKGELEWFDSDKFTAKFGFETSKYEFKYLQNFTGNTDSTQQGSSGGSTNLLVDDYQSSIYGQLKYNIDELLSLQGGLRINYWQLSDLVTYDPRLSLNYRIDEKSVIKASWGQYHQNLRLATQPNFSFFDTWLPSDSTVPASKAEHYILSLESNLSSNYSFNFDIYYKKLDNISELNQNALQGSTVRDVFYIGKADAWGAEVFVQKKFGRLNGWVGYAIGFIEAQFDSINRGETFRPKYDRTHDFKIVANYTIDNDWDVGASFFFQTGQSYTGVTSRVQIFLPDQNFGKSKVIPSQRYGLRLPPSHQLNLTASYKFKMWGLDAKAIMDIYNLYSRRDILLRYYNTKEDIAVVEDVKLIPILPTISLEVKF
ncbi:MAG TPA: TonB-dependent receptor [Candidatus Kapabacteria bacterium]|nr:TonB-dependent receptor [Candidatus Kapabacteria bacterium]